MPPGTTPDQAADEILAADAAAWGKVAKRTVLGPDSVRYKIKVLTDYKDNLPRKFVFKAARSSAACGIDVPKGRRLGMLLTKDDGAYLTNSCQLRTRKYLDSAGDYGARSSRRVTSGCAAA